MSPDVIVVGLGSMGSAAAWHLARRGVSVVGIDRFMPPHDHGAHRGGTRIIRMAYAEGADYVPLLRRAYDLWAELAAATGERLITRTGGLMIGQPGSSIVAGALLSARTHGLAHEVLSPDDVAKRFPAFQLADDEVAVFEPAAGVVHPEATITAHLALARAAGARLRFDTRVLGWRADEDGVTVHTADGELHADRLVMAPGAGAGGLLGALGVPFTAQRRVQHYWRPLGEPAAYAPGAFPIWIWQDESGDIGYGLPWQHDHGGVKAAFHGGDDPFDPDLPNRPVSGREAARMRDWLAPRLPALAGGAWLDALACRYTLTPDEHFVVGRHPEHPRVAIAAGFSGHGFKFVPLIGEVLADLALTSTTRHPIHLFDPTRFRRPAAAPAVDAPPVSAR